MAQGQAKTSVRYIRSYDEYLKLRHRSPECKVGHICPLNAHLAEVSIMPNEAYLGAQKNAQPVVYATVTGYARIAMHRDMRTLMRLGARLYYTGSREL